MDFDLSALESVLDSALDPARRRDLSPLGLGWLKQNGLVASDKKLEDLDSEQARLAHCMGQFMRPFLPKPQISSQFVDAVRRGEFPREALELVERKLKEKYP